MTNFWEAFKKASVEILRIVILGGLSLLITWLIQSGVALFFNSVVWDPTFELYLSGGILFGLRWLDKFIYSLQNASGETPKLLGVKFSGITGV